MRLTTFDLLARERPLPVSRPLQLGNDHRLIELRDRAEYFAGEHRNLPGCVAPEGAVPAVRREAEQDWGSGSSR